MTRLIKSRFKFVSIFLQEEYISMIVEGRKREERQENREKLPKKIK